MSQDTMIREYTVSVMSCSHRVLSVSEEVRALAGADRVDGELASGRLAVDGDVSDEAVRDAVAEAGYEVVA